MNLANIKSSLTTTINTAVTNGDLATAPIDTARIVNDLANLLQTEEKHALQKNTDVKSSSNIAKSLGRPT